MRVFTLCVLFALAACNTISGVGQDLESAGQAINNAAK